MIRHFAGVAEIVEDFEAAVQFYRDTLGLEVESLSEGYATATIPAFFTSESGPAPKPQKPPTAAQTPQNAFLLVSP